MLRLGQILTDRGSKYAVSGCPVSDRAAIDAALADLKATRAYAKATHNTWAADLSVTGPIKSDDGESGAGMVIIRMLQREELHDHLIVVTRWYGANILAATGFAMSRPVCALIWKLFDLHQCSADKCMRRSGGTL